MKQSIDPALASRGWIKLKARLSDADCCQLLETLPERKPGKRVDFPARIPLTEKFRAAVRQAGFDTTPLRATYFVKDRDQNWSLPWHQDRAIDPSRPREDLPEIELRNMAFAHVALDDISSGGIEVAETSHRHGIIFADRIDVVLKNCLRTGFDLKRGEAILVMALTLHRSAPVSDPVSRRCLRLDFLRD